MRIAIYIRPKDVYILLYGIKMQITVTEHRTVKLTRAAKALIEKLELVSASVITDYQLFTIFRELYKNPEGLYLRGKTPTVSNYRITRNLLIRAKIITRDKDYNSTYQILNKQDMSAEDVVCSVDPFCYVSHLSAMQLYGLTDRRPEALHLTIPDQKHLRHLIKEKINLDYGEELDTLPEECIHKLNIVHHPHIVRKRKLNILASAHYGQNLQKRGSQTRIATIGQTFLNMLEEPERCGGMSHVLDVWQEHAQTYLNDIINTVDQASKSIQKVRAGYILNELLSIEEPKILKWLEFAQRGGSRVLDHSKPFKPDYSEKWMLSINV